MANQIKTFTSKGTAAPGTTRAGVKVPPLGHFDTTTGQIYQHPRVVANPLTGRNVTVTNPKAAPDTSAQRTAGLGMGAGTTGSVGQRGRNGKDVGSKGEL